MVREWSGGPTGCPEVVVRAFGMSRSGRETLPDVLEWWEALPDVREWSGGPSKCPGVVGKHFRMSGRPSRKSRTGREALPNVRELSGVPPE